MRGCSALADPRGTLTLKASAVLVEGSFYDLYEELWRTVRATQEVVDAVWELDKLPTNGQMHQMFYKRLKEQSFRAHQAKQIYKYARALVVSAKQNGGKRPVLRKLTARLDRYDTSLDFSTWTLTLKMRNKVKIKSEG